MQLRFMQRLASALSLLALHTLLPVGWAQRDVTFKRHELNASSQFSAATAFDVNGDGRLDIVSGAWWYEAPQWQKHYFRDVEQIRGRFNDYSNLALDVDRDGDLDIVSVNYRSNSLYWCRNPGPEAMAADGGTLWPTIEIDQPGASETGRLADLDGDGDLDVLPSGTDFAAWYEVQSVDQGKVQWRRHDLPQQLIGHGIGAGDINGDGRMDVVGPKGWAEAPAKPSGQRWRWHGEFELARDCGLPILVLDVDGDGDSDLVWGRGHDVGIYWTEQIDASERSLQNLTGTPLGSLSDAVSHPKWVTHAIDTSWSCAHTLQLADIDGDGIDDLVAGKRFQGHDGRDPDENDTLRIYWYAFVPETRTWSRHVVSYGNRCGIDLDATTADIDGDGDIDIIAPSRSGLHWLENLRIGTTAADSPNQKEGLGLATLHQDDHRQLLVVNGQPIDAPLEFGLRRDHIRQGMQQVMGQLPKTDQRVPTDVQIHGVTAADGYTRLQISYQADPEVRVPALLLIPDGVREKTPALLCLHPTHFELGKAQICGLGGNPDRFYAHELAQQGFVCLAPDYPGFGQYDYDFDSQPQKFASGSMRAIWDNIRALDVLEQLPCVDGDRIGAIGHSLGGHNALFTAAFDGRIRCVVTSCGFNSFAHYKGGDMTGWSSARYMPRIASRFELDPGAMPFDFTEVLGLVAPRPLLVIAPEQDSNFAVAGVRECETAVRPVYEVYGKADAVHFRYPAGGHDFPPESRQQAYQWQTQALKR